MEDIPTGKRSCVTDFYTTLSCKNVQLYILIYNCKNGPKYYSTQGRIHELPKILTWGQKGPESKKCVENLIICYT